VQCSTPGLRSLVRMPKHLPTKSSMYPARMP
jgi:hypothetical protein